MPISLNFRIGKVFTKAIEARNKRCLNLHQPVEETGFRSGYSTIAYL